MSWRRYFELLGLAVVLFAIVYTLCLILWGV
jgi:hypothetical protein